MPNLEILSEAQTPPTRHLVPVQFQLCLIYWEMVIDSTRRLMRWSRQMSMEQRRNVIVSVMVVVAVGGLVEPAHSLAAPLSPHSHRHRTASFRSDWQLLAQMQRPRRASLFLSGPNNDGNDDDESLSPVVSDEEENSRQQQQQQQQFSRMDAVRKLLRQEESRVGPDDGSATNDGGRRDLLINSVAAGLLAACGVAAQQLYATSVYTPPGFRRLPSTQFIAALGDPTASEGPMESPWGLWRLDPGPRGVALRDYDALVGTAASSSSSDLTAPAGWTVNPNDWWLEEHGIIMEQPDFSPSALPPGRYLVTGGRRVTTGLTITDDDPTTTGGGAAGGGGDRRGQRRRRWKLDDGATLSDVTHLPCRAARYRPTATGRPNGGSSPKTANARNFPVAPGAAMPAVAGCTKQDYAVLFFVGTAALPPP